MRQEEERRNCLGFYITLVEFYTEEVLWGFLPCGFLEENICVLVFLCFCACFCFGDILLTNCFKISSKQFKEKSRWYQSHPERKHYIVRVCY